jgi:hypothetical protein
VTTARSQIAPHRVSLSPRIHSPRGPPSSPTHSTHTVHEPFCLERDFTHTHTLAARAHTYIDIDTQKHTKTRTRAHAHTHAHIPAQAGAAQPAAAQVWAASLEQPPALRHASYEPWHAQAAPPDAPRRRAPARLPAARADGRGAPGALAQLHRGLDHRRRAPDAREAAVKFPAA